MKRTLRSLAAVFCGLIACPLLFAVPNEVGTTILNPFFQSANMNLEDFATLSSTWEPDAKLLGDWQAWQEPAARDTAVLTYRLNMGAVVFGAVAQEVTVNLREDAVERFRVRFVPEGNSGDAASLMSSLRSNIKLYTGSEPVDAPEGGASYPYKQLTIRLREISGETGESATEVVIERTAS